MLVDLVIIGVLGLYGFLGYRYGFITQTAELLGFVAGFLAAFLLYAPVGGLLAKLISVPVSFAGLAAFLVIWFVVEFVWGLAWRRLKDRIPKDLAESTANQIGGVGPGLFKGLILVLFVLLIIAAAPLPTAAKEPFVSSPISKTLLAFGTGVQQQFNNVFGDALKDTLAFKTIKTTSGESADLGFTSGGDVCEADEEQMRELVNRERTARGLGTVRPDDGLRDVGRAHSRDMLARGYFSHNTPEGVDPFQRMDAAGVDYLVAGENLAFAPTVDIAHSGLMNSPGHKANILKPEFTRLGIGCMDAGFRGKMFSQEFAGP